jgi:gamma-glutamyltranspeptidase/glutathione hydrolase
MKKGIVATGSQEATQAAIAMLENGGNAVDAAVAAVFTSMTSEFALTGVAGGGAMMVKIAGNDPLLYDFFVNTPSLKQIKGIDFVKATVNFGSSTQHFYIGKGSVAIPGSNTTDRGN